MSNRAAPVDEKLRYARKIEQDEPMQAAPDKKKPRINEVFSETSHHGRSTLFGGASRLDYNDKKPSVFSATKNIEPLAFLNNVSQQ